MPEISSIRDLKMVAYFCTDLDCLSLANLSFAILQELTGLNCSISAILKLSQLLIKTSCPASDCSTWFLHQIAASSFNNEVAKETCSEPFILQVSKYWCS